MFVLLDCLSTTSGPHLSENFLSCGEMRLAPVDRFHEHDRRRHLRSMQLSGPGKSVAAGTLRIGLPSLVEANMVNRITLEAASSMLQRSPCDFATAKCKKKGKCCMPQLYCKAHCPLPHVPVTDPEPQPRSSPCDFLKCKQAICAICCDDQYCNRHCTCIYEARKGTVPALISPCERSDQGNLITPRAKRSGWAAARQKIKEATYDLMHTPTELLRVRTEETTELDNLFDMFPPSTKSMRAKMPCHAARHGHKSSRLGEMGKDAWHAMIGFLYHITVARASIICSSWNSPRLLVGVAESILAEQMSQIPTTKLNMKQSKLVKIMCEQMVNQPCEGEIYLAFRAVIVASFSPKEIEILFADDPHMHFGEAARKTARVHYQMMIEGNSLAKKKRTVKRCSDRTVEEAVCFILAPTNVGIISWGTKKVPMTCTGQSIELPCLCRKSTQPRCGKTI